MKKNKIYPWWFLVIPLLFYICFFLSPSLLGVGYSFTDWSSRSAIDGTHFVGLKNYIEIFTSDTDYASGILHTLMFTVVSNIVKLIPALLLAVMLQEGLRGKGIYRTILYLPSILPFVIIGIVFKSIFNFDHGLLNTVLEALNLEFLQQKWLSDLDVVWKSIFGVDACGDDGVATETRYIEILEFTHFVRFFNFHTLDINSKEKRLVDRITVVVALDIVTKDTK